jgi:hypothetical protein
MVSRQPSLLKSFFSLSRPYHRLLFRPLACQAITFHLFLKQTLNKVHLIMRNRQLNNNGFGALGVLAVIVVLVLAGGAGVYVYHRNHKAKTVSTSTTAKTSTSTKTTTTTTTAPNPYSGWKTYTSAVSGFSFKYPSNWTLQSSTNNGGAEDVIVTSPDDFQIQALSFARSSSYGSNTFAANPSGTCGSTCTATSNIASVNISGLGRINIEGQTQGAGGGTVNNLVLLTTTGSSYIKSSIKEDTYSTFVAMFQGKTQAENTNQTLSQFVSGATTQTAEQIYKSLTYPQ